MGRNPTLSSAGAAGAGGVEVESFFCKEKVFLNDFSMVRPLAPGKTTLKFKPHKTVLQLLSSLSASIFSSPRVDTVILLSSRRSWAFADI